MDFLKAVNIIGRDLEEAMALLEQLDVSGSDLAEAELARSRVRSAADLVKLLPSLNAANEKKPESQPLMAGHQVAAVVAEVAAETTTPPVAENDTVAAPVMKTETVVSQAADIETDATPVLGTEPVASRTMATETASVPVMEAGPVAAPRPAAAGQKSQEPSKAILADRFIPGGTLGEKITTGKKEEVVSSVIHSKPISDIAAAIGINDRFYFIRELFSGDAMAYSDTIGRLNSAASLGEAMKILDESTVMGSDPAAQSSFVDVVRRKFSVNV